MKRDGEVDSMERGPYAGLLLHLAAVGVAVLEEWSMNLKVSDSIVAEGMIPLTGMVLDQVSTPRAQLGPRSESVIPDWWRAGSACAPISPNHDERSLECEA